MHDRDQGLGAREIVYANYMELKGWTAWRYTPDEAETYRGELRADDLRGCALLEIGFGSGSLLAWAKERGAQLAGTEINPACIEAARERGVEILPNDLAVAAEENAGRFDVIVAFDVFEHLSLEDVRRSLACCAIMLKEGGRLLLRFPNCQSPFGALHQYGDVTHRTPLSGDHLRQLVVDLPLRVAEVRPAYRMRGEGVARKFVRAVRFILQDVIQAFVRFVYVYTAPLAPVVVVELLRLPETEANAKDRTGSAANAG
jgi:SAM-dependent methyltransferase